ncbi:MULTISPECIES: hypothetical protein [Hyphobacterium]|uniref:Polysaccharide deacetylase n=1 Tax=Hyphobacterium vulgare TaxID=1736751 RepID=A0ABV6ZZY3_9PROT
MRELPAALTFDLDPDIFDESISSSNARTRLSWRGISEGVPAIRAALDVFAPGIPVTWFVRVDNQIADIYGRPGHLLEQHRGLFEDLRARGDEIAWHPHLYRRKDEGWEQETDDAALLTAMQAAIADMRALGFEPRCGRIGEAYGSTGLMAAFDACGIPYDSTAMSGRKRIDGERSIDWLDTPRTAYRPSKSDHRVPGSPAHDVIEIPMSMLKVKADYDAEPFLRYLDLSYRTEAVACGMDSLVSEAPYLVAVTHPSALMPDFAPMGGHGLLSFDLENMTRTLRLLAETAAAKCRELTFTTLGALGDRIAEELGRDADAA